MSTTRHRALRSDAAANRDRLLAAATVAVKRDGEKVPMATVAAQAGVGVGTVYGHYPTREALVSRWPRSRTSSSCPPRAGPPKAPAPRSRPCGRSWRRSSAGVTS